MVDEPHIMRAEHGQGRVRLWDRQDAFGPVLALIALSLVFEAQRASFHPLTGMVGVVVRVFTLLLTLRTTRDPVRTTRLDVVIVTAVIVLGVAASPKDHDGPGLVVSSAVLALVVALQMFVIGRRLLRRGSVDRSTASGALSVYLLIGSFSAGIYGILAAGPGALFAAGQGDGNPLVRLYFSFITLTTVGFGDYAPGTPLAKMVVVLEALTGQLYLVTVVALVIGGLGASRKDSSQDG